MTNKKYITDLFKDIDFDCIRSAESGLDFYLWAWNEIEILNKDYNVDEFLPGYYGVGSDRGGELLAVDLSSGIFYSIPFILMDAKDRVKIADSTEELLKMKK